MSNVKTNKFGDALLFILGEFAAADAEMIEDGGMDVFGEDDQGREGSCEVSINDLAQAASHEINHLTEQLAKANERVAELEFQHQLLTKRIEPLLDMQEDGEHYARCHLADDIYEAFIEGSSVDALNKFAIENQIKGIKDLVRVYDSRGNIVIKESDAIEKIEQLRKEQEHG